MRNVVLLTETTLFAVLLFTVVSLPFAAYTWDWLHGDLTTQTPRRTERVDHRTEIVQSTAGNSERPDRRPD